MQQAMDETAGNPTWRQVIDSRKVLVPPSAHS